MHRRGESDVFSPFASDISIIVVVEAAEIFPEVRRVSAILGAPRSAAFQEQVAPAVAATEREARVEQRDLGRSNSPMHPNQVRTGARKTADTRQERHKAVIKSP